MRTLVWTLVVLFSYGCGGGGGGDGSDADTPPGPDRRTATITPAGGVLTSADGRLVITFPAGSVAADTELWVEPAAEPRAYQLGPDGQVFSMPATAVMAFPLAEVVTSSGTPLLVLMSESSAHGLEALVSAVGDDGLPLAEPTAVMKVDGGTVRLTGRVSHFSTIKTDTLQSLFYIYETNAAAEERVADPWQATFSIRNQGDKTVSLAWLESAIVPCPDIAVVVPHGNACGSASNMCCERLDGALLGPSQGELPPGGSASTARPVEYACAKQGAVATNLGVVLHGLARPYAASYRMNMGTHVTCVAATCGNGMLDPGEQCDGMAFPGGSANCPSPTWDGGTRSCTSGCVIDTTPCYRCNDGMREGPEVCDGADLAGQTCMGLGFLGGTLACSATCGFDTSGCTNMMCGNAAIEGSEQCDGANLGGANCMSVNSMFNGGTLACSGQCAFDTSGCKRCGDGMRNLPESCDGADLGGASCTSLGYASGTLGCKADCSYNLSPCSYCGNGTIDAGEICDGTNLNGATCQAAGYTAGTPTCTSACTLTYGDCTTCGDNLAEGTEICDGTDLPAGSCANLGFNAGTLSCSSSCTYTGCFNMSTCNNGIVEPGEACDDGNTSSSDGCFNCTVQGGYTCTGSPSVCVITCGNGQIDGSETCDDGFRESGDGCSNNCTTETGFTCSGTGQGSCTTMCGDGVTRGFEICDDGNPNNTDGCDTSCRIPGAASETEPNDDGTPSIGNDFSAAAANGPFDVVGATDLIIQARIYGPSGQSGDDDVFAVRNPSGASREVRFDTYAGDTGLGNSCGTLNTRNTRLQIRDAGGSVLFQNDDRSGSDRCSGVTYTIAPMTTVYVQITQGFEVDNVPAYMLRIRAAVCGDNLVQFGEECELPNTAICDSQCQRVPRCNDGFIDGAEQCDDLNMTSGDGCSSTCQWEAIAESEPNDDGAVATTTNDFSAANADGPLFATGMFDASISPEGDDDVFAIANPTMGPITVRVDTWNQFFGVGNACGGQPDTLVVVRDAGGTELQRNNDRNGSADRCSGLDVPLAPLETKYLHVTQSNDLFTTLNFWLRVVYP